MLSYKYPLYPTSDQVKILDDQLEQCRLLYNFLLDQRDIATKSGKRLSRYDSQALIPKYCVDHPEALNIYSKVRQMINYTLYASLKSLGELKKKGFKVGRLRFKSEGWYKTLNFNQSGFKIDWDSHMITLSNIGTIRFDPYRPIPSDGKIKGVIIKRSDTKWYAIIQIENEIHPLPKSDKEVGIDMGINTLTTDSDGNQIENPKYIDHSFEKIKRYQRKLSKKKKGSSNYLRAKSKLANIHDTVANQRRDYLHKVSRYYVNKYDTICIEDLNILPMTKKNRFDKRSKKTLHRHDLDASWGQLTFYLLYKAENAGRQIVLVDPKNTSQRCSKCGEIVKKELSDRVHTCPFCGFTADRDYNASINILKAGAGHPIVPIESRPLHRYTSQEVVTGQVLAMT